LNLAFRGRPRCKNSGLTSAAGEFQFMRLATIKFASKVPYAKVSGFPIPERGTEKQILFGGSGTRVLSGLFDKVTASFPV
jgi:hypothetical protein